MNNEIFVDTEVTNTETLLELYKTLVKDGYVQNMFYAEEYHHDHYIGSFTSVEDYAMDFYSDCEELNNLDNILCFAIDWEAVASELMHNRFFLEVDGGTIFLLSWLI